MIRFALYEKLGERRAVPLGRSGAAFLFTFWWLIVKGLWLEALAVVAFILFVVFPVFPAAPVAGLLLGSLPSIWLWLEGRNMVADRLLRRGWQQLALVDAHSPEGAVEAYGAAPRPTPPPLPKTAPPQRPRVQGNLKGPAPFGMEGL